MNYKIKPAWKLISKLSFTAVTAFIFISITTCLNAGMENEGSPSWFKNQDPPQLDEFEQKWGIDIKGVYLLSAGYMLDFRYRIVDPKKAAPLVSRKNKPVLINQSTGAKLIVPSPPKVGPLRQAEADGIPKKDRVYFVMFANPAKHVKAGDKVTVEIGDFKAENIEVH